MRALLRAATVSSLLACGCGSMGSLFDEGSVTADDPLGEGPFRDPAGQSDAAPSGRCLPDLTGVVRDFRDDHPDFERFVGSGESGIVEDVLGGDHKPVYRAGGASMYTTGKTFFDQWYRDVPGVNVSMPYTLPLTETSKGLYTFDDQSFFPIDGRGHGNEGRAHNHHFTFELHTEFVYRGGEEFTFAGDDDLWVFVNRRLAIDLGGVHDAMTAAIDFDARAAALGIAVGGTYELSIFHAERHTPGSTFRVETTVEFTNCAAIVR